MQITEHIQKQVERFLRKISEKFPMPDNTDIMTDIHIRVYQESGELRAFDDEDNEITRCVIEEWIDNKEDNFNEMVSECLRSVFLKQKNISDNIGILKPYGFVLEDIEGENISELYVSDDETVILGGDLLPNWEKDLDLFFNQLFDTKE